MIALVVLLVVMFGILGFRVYRTVQYYNEAHNSSDPGERNVARTNFMIHLVFCLVLSLVIATAIYLYVL